MPLEPCADASPAAWITGSELSWGRLVSLGPAGFEAYARLRFIPDPVRPGQAEADAVVGPDTPSEHDRLRTALEVLRGQTGTPDEAYFCIWDGWGWAPRARAAIVRVPARSFYLFRGSLSDFGEVWDLEGAAPRRGGPALPDPAYVWPADHAWCVANDVDPHYAGVGGSAAAITRLLETPGLDVVRADPDEEQPAYR